MLGTARVEPVLRRIRNGMAGAGMVVESAKGECNLGQHEIAFRYADALTTCDNHSIYKTGAKEIADQAGMALTFMAKYDEREGNSCHIHISLRGRRRRHDVFPGDGPHGFSPLFAHFLAGQQACLRELTYLFAPNVNSYKRFAAGSFAPTAVGWGMDNRTCSLRVVGHGAGLRVENRVPGGDVNPYLAVAALIAAGLHGIEQELPLPPELTGNAYVADAPRVPSTLRDAADAFAALGGGGRGVRRGGRRALRQRRPRGARGVRRGRHRLGAAARVRAPVTPLIGITAYGEQAAWGVWEQEAVLLPRTYTDAVIEAGGLPVLLAPRVESADVVDRLDARGSRGRSRRRPGPLRRRARPAHRRAPHRARRRRAGRARAGVGAGPPGAGGVPGPAGAQRRARRHARAAPPGRDRAHRAQPAAGRVRAHRHRLGHGIAGGDGAGAPG